MTRTLTFLLLLAAPVAAHAQSDSHWYGAASVDISLLQDTDGTIDNAPVPGKTVQTFNPVKTGIGGQIAIGHTFGPARFELEGGYTRNTQDRYVAIVPPTGTIPGQIKRTAWRAMINGYYDFGHGRVQPYIGAGAGVLSAKVDFFAARAPFPTEAPRQLINDSDTRFAYQLMAGAALRVGPRLQLTAGYRWLDAGSIHPYDARGERTTNTYRGHHIDLGLRVAF
jgi:OmpA-OmpF porin, OOP family